MRGRGDLLEDTVLTDRGDGTMRKILLTALALLGGCPWVFSGPVPPSGCPTCIQNSAAPQNAQVNIGTAVVRGTLTVSTLTATYFSIGTMNAGSYIGNGGALTDLNASELKIGTVPVGRLFGQYLGVSGVGALSTGTWNASVIGTQWGGTGKNWVAIAQGNLPYFSATGVMSTLSPGTAGALLQTNGAGANPSWTSAPQIVGTNVTSIPLANLLAGNLPQNVAINDSSISTVSAAKVIGNISGGASFLTVPLPIGNLAGGTLPTSNAASSITVNGVVPGVYGGPTQLAQINVHADGRIYSVSQSSIVINPNQISSGTLAPLVLVPAANITSGTLNNSVIASSLNATGVAPGVYGGPTQSAQLTIGVDGRITSATQLSIPGASTSTAMSNVDNAWNHSQTSLVGSSWTIKGNLSAFVTTFTFVYANGYGLTNLTAANISAGTLGPAVIASSVAASGVGAGIYGTATEVPRITIGVDGRVSTATTVTITGVPASSVPAAGVQPGNLGPLVIASSLNATGVTAATIGSSSQSLSITVAGDGRLSAAAASAILIVPSQVSTLVTTLNALAVSTNATSASTTTFGLWMGTASASLANLATSSAAFAVWQGTISPVVATLGTSTNTLQSSKFNVAGGSITGQVSIVSTLTVTGSDASGFGIKSTFAIQASSFVASSMTLTGTSGYALTSSTGISIDGGGSLRLYAGSSIVWPDGSVSTTATSGSDPGKLNVTGGTLTGQLTIAGATLTVTGLDTSGFGEKILYGIDAGSITSRGGSTVVGTMTVIGNSFSVSASTFFVSAGFVGIRTLTPSAALDVKGAASFGNLVASTFSANTGDLTMGKPSQIFVDTISVRGNMTVRTTMTITGNAFSVGVGSFTISGGSATVAYSMTAARFIGDGSGITNITAAESNTFGFGGGTKTFLSLVEVASMTNRGASTVVGTMTVLGNAFSVGGSTFVITSGSVGIGAISPNGLLDVNGAAVFGLTGTRSTITAQGRILVAVAIGVNTNNPGAMLELKTAGANNMSFGDLSGDNTQGAIGLAGSLASNSYNFRSGNPDTNLYINAPTAKAIKFRENDVDKMVLNGSSLTLASGIGLEVGGAATFRQAATTVGTMTVLGNAFSVGGATLAVANGQVAVGVASAENSEGWERVIDLFGANTAKMSVRSASINLKLYAHQTGIYGAPGGVPGGGVGLTSDRHFNIFTNSQSRILVRNDGAVGIGTTNPSENLEVVGSIKSDYGVLAATGVFSSTLTVQGSAFSIGGASFTVVGGSATIAYLMTARAFAGDGSALTNLPSTGESNTFGFGGGTKTYLSLVQVASMTNRGVSVTVGTAVVQGNAFSVGTASFTVVGGSATVAYLMTARAFAGDGSALTGLPASGESNTFGFGGSTKTFLSTVGMASMTATVATITYVYGNGSGLFGVAPSSTNFIFISSNDFSGVSSFSLAFDAITASTTYCFKVDAWNTGSGARYPYLQFNGDATAGNHHWSTKSSWDSSSNSAEQSEGGDSATFGVLTETNNQMDADSGFDAEVCFRTMFSMPSKLRWEGTAHTKFNGFTINSTYTNGGRYEGSVAPNLLTIALSGQTFKGHAELRKMIEGGRWQ